MTYISITKTSAAQRQLDAAIRIMFSGEDPLAVHSIAAAAHGIVKDLAQQRSEEGGTWRLKQSIDDFFHKFRPHTAQWQDSSKFLGSFINKMNRPANFLKHADRDHKRSLHEAELNTDTLLLFSCITYTDLGLPLTAEMNAYCRWHLAIYPRENGDAIQTAVGGAHKLRREHQLEFGKRLLELHQERQSDS